MALGRLEMVYFSFSHSLKKKNFFFLLFFFSLKLQKKRNRVLDLTNNIRIFQKEEQRLMLLT